MTALSLLPCTALARRTLLPVGPAYLAHVGRSIHNPSFEQHDHAVEEERKRHQLLNGETIEDDLGVGDEPETEDLLLLDPKEWKVLAYNIFLKTLV